MTYRLAVDAGGTFTDLLLLDEASGAFWRHKPASIPHDGSEGILGGVNAVLTQAAITALFEIDVRYAGQAFEVPLTITRDILEKDGTEGILARFDDEHLRLITSNIDTPHDIVNLCAVAQRQAPALPAATLPEGDADPSAATIRDHAIGIDSGGHPAVIYDYARLRQGDVIPGPAIITEMDSTTLVEHDCTAVVDAVGNILITLA